MAVCFFLYLPRATNELWPAATAVTATQTVLRANGQFYTEIVVFCIVYKIISLATFMTLLNTINYNCFIFF